MKYVVANWKMNMNLEKMTQWVEFFGRSEVYKDNLLNKSKPRVEIIIAPSLVHIPMIYEFSQNLGIKVCSQDVSAQEKGAHTGEVGAFQIRDFCRYTLVGHSERKENRDVVTEKRDRCLEEGVIPIVCFVNPEDLPYLHKKGVVVAWEDPENISKNGVYKPKDPETISKIAKEIRKIIPKETPLIYGGSVNENNIKGIVDINEIDGVLVGNASLDPKIFTDIIHFYQ